MADRMAMFDLVETVVAALNAATASGQPLEGVGIHDGPVGKDPPGVHLYVGAIVEDDRNDVVSLDAAAYEVVYDLRLGFSYYNPAQKNESGYSAMRREIGERVQAVAALLEADSDLWDIVAGVEVVPSAYTPVTRSDGLQVVAEAAVLFDVTVEP